MFIGAAVGAFLVTHVGHPVVWPLIAAAVLVLTATSLWARHPSSVESRKGAGQ
jgi:uncharacterized membrane protein YoaK (UPF0700 family)